MMWKNIVAPGRPQMTLQYGACTLHAEHLRLQTQTQNMEYLLLFHCNSGCTNAPECYIVTHCLSCYVQKRHKKSAFSPHKVLLKMKSHYLITQHVYQIE
jgi:hypothetical protein